MEIRYFAHSWLSDWNHGNAHFLRGFARALVRRGHSLRLYEPLSSPFGGWALSHLIHNEPLNAAASIQQFRHAYPELEVRFFALPGTHIAIDPALAGSAALLLDGIPVIPAPPLPPAAARALAPAPVASRGTAGSRFSDRAHVSTRRSRLLAGSERSFAARMAARLADQLDPELRGADLAVVHEWNEPELIEALLTLRSRYRFRLLLHDTHHRAASEERVWSRLPLHQLDGILVFGESLRRLYRRVYGLDRVYVLHEAADADQFHPLPTTRVRWDLVWIGNWGDEERSRELEEFLLRPAARLRPRPILAHGVRYPAHALDRLRESGVLFGGYLPNLETPALYASARLTLHIPRAPYRTQLGGIPTIRVFEALACGCPLLSAPWRDDEHLFTPGRDFLTAADGREMTALLLELLDSEHWRRTLAENGRRTILARHTCDHRASQLEEICRTLA